VNSPLIGGIVLTVFGALFTLRAVWGLRNPAKDLARNRENGRRMRFTPERVAKITAKVVRTQEWIFVAFGSVFTIVGVVALIGSLVGSAFHL
jgi:hypothetical protein